MTKIMFYGVVLLMINYIRIQLYVCSLFCYLIVTHIDLETDRKDNDIFISPVSLTFDVLTMY